MPTDDVVAFVRAALPAPPLRVLEVGAGEGELAAVLADAGYDVLAIDPAGRAPSVAPLALLAVDEPAASFDAAVAVVSLHHVDPLTASCQRLAELVRPGGRLIVDEFDVERFDQRAAGWLLDQWAAAGRREVEDAAGLVASLREHLHPLSRLADVLARGFVVGTAVPGPYLHRWDLPPGLRPAEEALIARGEIPATGARFVAARRGAA